MDSHSSKPSGSTPAPSSAAPVAEAQHELLVIDDSPQSAAELRRKLSEPWRLSTARTVDEAFKALRSPARRLMLLSAEVAARDGGACCAKLRLHPNAVEAPLVLMAKVDTPTELLEACWRRGVDDCMVRPVRQTELLHRLTTFASGAALPATSPRRVPKTVAVVGDDTDYCDRLAELLQFTGFHVVRPRPPAPAPWPAVDLLVVAPRQDGALQTDRLSDLLRTARQHGVEAQVPLLLCVDGPGSTVAVAASTLHTTAPSPLEGVVHRVNALLQRAPVNLRAAERLPFFTVAEFREAVGGGADGWRSGFTFDISPGGVFFKTLVPCRPGSPLEIKLSLRGGEETLTLPGVVAWANPFSPRQVFSYPSGMGVQFLGAPPRRLVELLSALQRPAEEDRFG